MSTQLLFWFIYWFTTTKSEISNFLRNSRSPENSICIHMWNKPLMVSHNHWLFRSFPSLWTGNCWDYFQYTISTYFVVLIYIHMLYGQWSIVINDHTAYESGGRNPIQSDYMLIIKFGQRFSKQETINVCHKSMCLWRRFFYNNDCM